MIRRQSDLVEETKLNIRGGVGAARGVDLLKADIKTAKETFVEKTVDVECVKVDGTWYVKTVSDKLADVVSSNLFTAAKELAGTLGK